MPLLDKKEKREKVICIEKEREKKKRKESIDVGDLSLEQRDILILRCVN
jgi:hypothetical protein